MDAVGVANWQAKSQSLADNNQDNHGISSQKFHLLREFLMLGYRVFLSGSWRCLAACLAALLTCSTQTWTL
jgi:hypothetical protein